MNKIYTFFVTLLTVVAAIALSGCEEEHARFADHVQTTTYKVMRFRGQYTSSLDGVTLVDTICVADYVNSDNSIYGDSIVMHYIRLAPAAETWSTFGIRNIGILNEELSIRTSRVIPWIVRGNETVFLDDFPVTSFKGYYRYNEATNYRDDSLVFTCQVGDYTLRFTGGESSIRM